MKPFALIIVSVFLCKACVREKIHEKYEDKFYNNPYYDHTYPRLPLIKPHELADVSMWYLIKDFGYKNVDNCTATISELSHVYLEDSLIVFKGKEFAHYSDDPSKPFFVYDVKKEHGTCYETEEQMREYVKLLRPEIDNFKLYNLDSLWQKYRETGYLPWDHLR